MEDGGIVNGWLQRIEQVATKALNGPDISDEMRQVVTEAVGQITGWKGGGTPKGNLQALTGRVGLEASHGTHESQPKREEALKFAEQLLIGEIHERGW